VALLRKRGITRIYLAGLSNGAAGAARLAPRMRGVFRGLILISGAPRDADAPDGPVLVMQGRRDQMASALSARAYAGRFGGQYVELDAGHFALLLREEQAMQAIAAWLAKN
jgi:pimeloyl-ACP methyl ester carboxylesterase